jgi:predicted ribosomally synthesized peptide with nif11-like leader
MSAEAAKAFFERIMQDGAFAAKVVQCETIEGMIALAKAEGFDFTAADAAAGTGELSDEDLQNIIGGSAAPRNLLSLLTALRAGTGPLPRR